MPSKRLVPIRADLTIQEMEGPGEEQGISIQMANVYIINW